MTVVRSDTFESLIERSDTHVVLDLNAQSESLLVLFGGIAGGVSMPVFEFFKQTADFPVKKVFLRDPRRGWYQLGLPGVGDSAAAVRVLLDSVIARANVERVVMTGASAGGFAAMQFGTWCGADEVIAFSPQTFVDACNRARTGDTRWKDQIDALHVSLGTKPATLDLLDVLPTAPAGTRYQVHVSGDDPLDLHHAHRIVDRGSVEIFQHERGGHTLVKTLRDRGQLRPLLLAALGFGERAAGSHPESG